jgi:aquaporin Z
MSMIYAVGDVSGAHLNPAVSCGFFLAGRMRGRDAMGYVISQLIGACAASLLLCLLFPGHATLGATLPAGSALQSFVLETTLTALLMFVILSVAIGSKERGLMAGIAIGGVVGLEAMFAGPISGASMNPARSLAPALISGRLAQVWIYVAAPVLGAAVAVPLWRAVYNEQQKAPHG